jgi:hypothetical protein
MKRRAFLAGAAALAVVPSGACALPERLLQDDAPVLDVVPCVNVAPSAVRHG